MKSVLLDDEGYTADGDWRLVKIPNNPVTAAQHDFYHMISASPSPVLADAVPIGEISIEKLGRPFNSMRVGVHFYNEVPPAGTKLFTAPPAPAVPAATVCSECQGNGVISVVSGQTPEQYDVQNHDCPACSTPDKRIAELEAENQALRAALKIARTCFGDVKNSDGWSDEQAYAVDAVDAAIDAEKEVKNA